ncbi:SDR family oxidoreductase [Microbacterium sp. VKM Ac-2870]|uniref:SDR family NAD(P)-dependent oxidoreductase n=1 Tax=Microbacterium sp. VKM Ac-2870 TaxID=2783825 RepID=UPI00188D6F94|nr:SDR family NAD(P)-dependent oxidoreductase [Microbacterium sp. VKM Ac-2870]MBF4562815.1 SDR family oxidoreductase [Microbacterium sp. VKM Ac-2870]
MTTAIITGGGTGIGRAIAARLVADGGNVVLVGRSSGPIEKTAEELGSRALALVADAGERDAMDRVVEIARERFGAVDQLVANAGGHGFSAVADTDDAEWAASLHANLTTAFVTVRACLPALVESRGSIVIVSSIAGIAAGPDTAGYTTAKHALLGLTRSIARDYGPAGVRANALCPGWTVTPMADSEMRHFAEAAGIATIDEAYAEVTRNVPLRRPARAEEIASIARFLLSEEAAYVTGAVIVADGGAGAVDLPTIAFDGLGL